MAGYGYRTPRFGSKLVSPMQPFAPSRSLAQAAAGTPSVGDPFGLLSKKQSPPGSALIDGGIVAPKSQPVQPPQGPVSQPPPSTPQAPAASTQQTPQAPAAPAYDLNTDPALQAVNAYSGLSDQQAQAAADKQRRDALLAYGDPNLARSVLNDNLLATAAANNPTSTLSQLGHQRDLAEHDLLNNLTTGGHNLGYSGYRINQESELGRQYQDALASAASDEQAQLAGINASLQQALAPGQQQRLQALSDAYNRQLQYALANPPTGDQQDTTPPPAGGFNAPAAMFMPGASAARLRRFAS